MLLGATLAALAVAAAASEPAAPAAAQTIRSVFAPGLTDLAVTARPDRSKTDIGALEKIGKDFPNAYRVSRLRFFMKEPDRFRMEAVAGPLKFVHKIRGGSKATLAFGIVRRSKPFGDDPGKRQTPMDVGVITAGSLRGYTPEYVGAGTEAGRPVARFRLRYAHDTARYELVSVDTERKCLVKRVLHTRMFGELKCEFVYTDPQKVGSVWVPTRIEVRNSDHKLAGVMLQSDFRVNTGLSEDLFRF